MMGMDSQCNNILQTSIQLNLWLFIRTEWSSTPITLSTPAVEAKRYIPFSFWFGLTQNKCLFSRRRCWPTWASSRPWKLDFIASAMWWNEMGKKQSCKTVILEIAITPMPMRLTWTPPSVQKTQLPRNAFCLT